MNNLNETHYKTNKWKCPENSKPECEWHKIEEEMKKLQEEATDKHKYISAAESVIDSMYNFFNDEWNDRYDYNVLNPSRNIKKDPSEIWDQGVNKCRKLTWTTETTTSPGIINTDEVYTKPFKVSEQGFKDSSIYKKLYSIDTEKVDNPSLNSESEKSKKEYEYVNHPDHYNRYPMEVIEMFEKLYGGDATAKWCEMTALKYRLRMGLKPGQDCKQDLEKEQWYLNKAKELYEKMKNV